jgi:uncharacterized membrane protein YeiB
MRAAGVRLPRRCADSALGAYLNLPGWGVRYSFFFGGQLQQVGSILVALRWSITFISEQCSSAHAARGGGRIAFTNYILETLICTRSSTGTG